MSKEAYIDLSNQMSVKNWLLAGGGAYCASTGTLLKGEPNENGYEDLPQIAEWRIEAPLAEAILGSTDARYLGDATSSLDILRWRSTVSGDDMVEREISEICSSGKFVSDDKESVLGACLAYERSGARTPVPHPFDRAMMEGRYVIDIANGIDGMPNLPDVILVEDAYHAARALGLDGKDDAAVADAAMLHALENVGIIGGASRDERAGWAAACLGDRLPAAREELATLQHREAEIER